AAGAGLRPPAPLPPHGGHGPEGSGGPPARPAGHPRLRSPDAAGRLLRPGAGDVQRVAVLLLAAAGGHVGGGGHGAGGPRRTPAASRGLLPGGAEIGRASCRDKVWFSEVAVA